MNTEIPKMMSIKEVAKTGLLTEHALRVMVKNRKAPFIMIGNKVIINYSKLLKQLSEL